MVQFQGIRSGYAAGGADNAHGNVCFCGCKSTGQGPRKTKITGQMAQTVQDTAVLNRRYQPLSRQSARMFGQILTSAVRQGQIGLGNAVQLMQQFLRQQQQTLDATGYASQVGQAVLHTARSLP